MEDVNLTIPKFTQIPRIIGWASSPQLEEMFEDWLIARGFGALARL